jgi:hypothetical protein
LAAIVFRTNQQGCQKILKKKIVFRNKYCQSDPELRHVDSCFSNLNKDKKWGRVSGFSPKNLGVQKILKFHSTVYFIGGKWKVISSFYDFLSK